LPLSPSDLRGVGLWPAFTDFRTGVPRRRKKIVGCGGWSKRKTLFGSDYGSGREDGLLDPRCDNARIRAFFVHSDFARRGIGSKILETCENAATEAGFKGFALGATIAGERLYRERGYQAIEWIGTPLVNGASLPIIRMSKRCARTEKP
jgi:GNAT superfamily N-acetyltransferase